MVIQDEDYVLYKNLASFIIKKCEVVLEKINAKVLPKIMEYEKLKAKYFGSGNYEQFGENSKRFYALREKIIYDLAVQDRVQVILNRNKERLVQFNLKLENLGIYNQNVDKKAFSKAIASDAGKITTDGLNLNAYSDNGVVYKFFAGEVLAFKNDELDFSIEENEFVLANATSEFIHEAIFAFPYSVATISDNCLMSPFIKNNVLKECILFVSEKLKTQPISKSNQELGGLLANAGQIRDISEYAEALKNYFNVAVKQNIKKNAPELSDDADKYLKCNEASEFLPASKRRAVLANGLAGDIPKTEAEESEEVRKEQEKEAKEQISREELLALMLADEDDLELENNEQDSAVLEAEERRLNEEKQLEEETELELQSALKKNDSVD